MKRPYERPVVTELELDVAPEVEAWRKAMTKLSQHLRRTSQALLAPLPSPRTRRLAREQTELRNRIVIAKRRAIWYRR